jgi:hypothetical protein
MYIFPSCVVVFIGYYGPFLPLLEDLSDSLEAAPVFALHLQLKLVTCFQLPLVLPLDAGMFGLEHDASFLFIDFVMHFQDFLLIVFADLPYDLPAIELIAIFCGKH